MVVLIKSLLIMAGSGVDGMERIGHDTHGSGTKGRKAGESGKHQTCLDDNPL